MDKYLLSNEVSRLSIYSKSSKTIEDLQTPIKRWILNVNVKKIKAHLLKDLANNILEAIEDSKNTGSKLHQYLKELNRFIRNIEQVNEKIQNIQKMYAFQGAITIILPWFVVFLFFKFNFNIIIALGLLMQLFGIILFSFILYRALKVEENEKKFILEKSLKLWSKSFSGNNFYKNLFDTFSLENLPSKIEYKLCSENWSNWVKILEHRDESSRFEFNSKFEESKNYSSVLRELLYSGVESNEILFEFTRRYMDEWIIGIEYKLMVLPNQIILLFCFMLGPSALFIMLGALWPLISNQI